MVCGGVTVALMALVKFKIIIYLYLIKREKNQDDDNDIKFIHIKK